MAEKPTMAEYLAMYEAAHQHPTNQATHAVGIPMIVASLVIVFFSWPIGLALFVLGWVLQFIGHAAEGNNPKFFQGPVFLLVGVVWVGLKLLRAVGLAKRPSV